MPDGMGRNSNDGHIKARLQFNKRRIKAMSTKEVSNSDDVVDSRDVIARIEELEEEREDLQNELEELQNNLEAIATDDEEIQDCKAQIEAAKKALTDWDDSSEGEELKALKALADQCEGYGDWEHGAQLVRDDYFEDFAREEAESLDLIKEDMRWPYACIDWKQAAEELQQDYTSVDWDGVTYWVRS
jgi:DNA repair exonuclease SbcCD ATPase subunit